jgi:hypothetical protein
MNGLADLVHKRALGMMWSAGLTPSREERARLRSEAWRHQPSDCWKEDAIRSSACDLLEAMGHATNREAAWDLAIREATDVDPSRPRAGHALRLTGRWSIAPEGAVLTLSSTGRTDGFRIGRGGHYMDHDGHVHLTCGGPSSALALDVKAMKPTGEIVRLPFWRFADLPGAGEGVDFTRPVALWEWNGDEADFLDRITELAA